MIREHAPSIEVVPQLHSLILVGASPVAVGGLPDRNQCPPSTLRVDEEIEITNIVCTGSTCRGDSNHPVEFDIHILPNPSLGKPIDNFLNRHGFPTLIRHISEVERPCADWLEVKRRGMRGVDILAYSVYDGFSYRSLARLGARSLYLMKRLHLEFQVGYDGTWARALVAPSWFEIREAVLEHSGHLYPLCSSHPNSNRCVSRFADIERLTKSLVVLDPIFFQTFYSSLASIDENVEDPRNYYDEWINYFEKIAEDAYPVNLFDNQPITLGELTPFASLQKAPARLLQALCLESIKEIARVHSKGLSLENGVDLTEYFYLNSPSFQVVLDTEITIPDVSDIRKDMIQLALLFITKFKNIGALGSVSRDFLSANLLLGPSERPAYDHWVQAFESVKIDWQPIPVAADRPELIFFQSPIANYDGRPFLQVKLATEDESHSFLFDTGSNDSYSKLDGDEVFTECVNELEYGGEDCTETIQIGKIFNVEASLGDNGFRIINDLTVHATMERNEEVDHNLGAGPGSDFAKAVAIFTFVPPYRLIPDSVNGYCPMLYIPMRRALEHWTIPGSVGVDSWFTNARLVLDTGANSYVDLPRKAYNLFVERMRVLGHDVVYNGNGEAPTVTNCHHNTKNFPIIQLAFGEPKDQFLVTLLADDYIISRDASTESCKIDFRPVTPGTEILVGIDVLRKLIVEFNSREQTIGLCHKPPFT